MIQEDLNDAYEELMLTEGKADGATCSGVRPPDSGSFEKKIALTFDDGPSLEKTPQVLEVLANHGAKATFFINGRQVRSADIRKPSGSRIIALCCRRSPRRLTQSLWRRRTTTIFPLPCWPSSTENMSIAKSR